MGKPVIPPQDPTRKQRILDEKRRMFGVDKEALDRQVQERKQREAQEREQDRAYAQAANWMDRKLVEWEAQSCQQQRTLNQSVDAIRRQQEEERRAREAAARASQAAADVAEQAAALASPFLNEAPEVGISAVDPRRVRPDHWKGFSPAQKADVLATQAAQAAEKRAAAERERAAEAAHAAAEREVLAAVAARAAAAEAARKQEQARMTAELARLAAEKQVHEAELNRIYDTNRPDEGYFAQWGTSHR
eukprot:scaffold5.g839.t1